MTGWTDEARAAALAAKRGRAHGKPQQHPKASANAHAVHKSISSMIKAGDYSYMFNANATGRTKMGDTVNKFLKEHPGGRFKAQKMGASKQSLKGAYGKNWKEHRWAA